MFEIEDIKGVGRIDRVQFEEILMNMVGDLNLSKVPRADADSLSRRLFASLHPNADGLMVFSEFKDAVYNLFGEDGSCVALNSLSFFFRFFFHYPKKKDGVSPYAVILSVTC
jgi:hypothetical protein